MSKYYICPVTDGLLDIDYRDLQEGVQTSATECYVKLSDRTIPRDTWQETTAEAMEQVKADLLEPKIE